jgi:tRNA(Ile)-lysidine synthase
MPVEGFIRDQRVAMMLQKVLRYIGRHRMSVSNEPICVAVSGGIDSMVLLDVLRRLYHPVQVLHVQHGLRGEESEADEQFVREHCKKKKIPFHCERVDVMSLVRSEKISVQMAARKLRYEVFQKFIDTTGQKIALAHHVDDAVETLLMGLMRGVGGKGLRNIPPVSGSFIRPLLCAGRSEIAKYAGDRNISFREDRSNADPKYFRNRVRLELLPLMEKMRPGSQRNMVRAVEMLREMNALMEDHLQEFDRAVVRRGEEKWVPLSMIRKSGSPQHLLFHLLREHGFHPDRIDALLDAIENGHTGSTFSDGGYTAIVDREDLIISPAAATLKEWIIGSIDDLPADIPLRISEAGHEDVDLSAAGRIAWMAKDKLRSPLKLRAWKSGDRMQPLGMKGNKLISDILIDAKVPRTVKDRTYVLEGGGDILWLIGHRISEKVKLDQGTEKVLRIEWTGGSQNSETVS